MLFIKLCFLSLELITDVVAKGHTCTIVQLKSDVDGAIKIVPCMNGGINFSRKINVKKSI